MKINRRELGSRRKIEEWGGKREKERGEGMQDVRKAHTLHKANPAVFSFN